MEIKEYPDNWEEIKNKYLDRQREGVEGAYEKHNVKSHEEHLKVIREILQEKNHRVPKQDLKDRTIIYKPQSKEVLNLADQLSAEISAVGQKSMSTEVPIDTGLEHIKERFSHEPPSKKNK